MPRTVSVLIALLFADQDGGGPYMGAMSQSLGSLFRIGARGSKLSLAQTEQVRNRWAAMMSVEPAWLEIVPIVTSGDRIQDRLLIEAGGKGLFTKELDEALIDGRIDIAIHSLKDLPTRLDERIALACVPEREDPRDAFVSAHAASLAALRPGANVGTASLRRQAQTLHARPDLGVVTLRGNVDTRLKKLEDGVADATFLALAGLKRLGLQDRATSVVDPLEAPPAACQGALAVTTRSDDAKVRPALAPLENAEARVEIEAERAFLDALDGSCRTAIGALARKRGDQLEFIGEALTPDGTARWRRHETIALGANAIESARALGLRLGGEIRSEAGDALVTDH
jgi:hydroxymethylbilane synthase